jgi:hypothetical protein
MKRCAFKLFVFLFAGAIINIAVAWGCALWLGKSSTLRNWGGDVGEIELMLDQSSRAKPYRDWVVEVIETHGFHAAFATWRDPDTAILAYFGLQPVERAEAMLPAWGSFLVPPQHPTGGQSHGRSIEAWGSPYLCLYTKWGFDGAHGVHHSEDLIFGIPVSSEAFPSRPSSRRALPLIPIFPGFAINTIFYAAIVWFLFFAPGAIRKRVRRKRGQCAACGYSLRGRGSSGDKCPECGASSG